MKYLFYFLVAGSLVSCDTDEPSEEKDIADPVNGVSEYLLLERKTSASGGQMTLATFEYDENGVVKSSDDVIPENLNRLSKPYIIWNGYLSLFCDHKKRVVKAETSYSRELYTYDEKDRIATKIVEHLDFNLKDTTVYTYYEPGENNHNGASYTTRSGNYDINPDGSVTRYFGYIVKNYYLSPTIKLKSWFTLPYNYGKIADAPVVRYTYTTKNGSMREETYTHTVDERGLIIKTEHRYLGGGAESTYSYIKR